MSIFASTIRSSSLCIGAIALSMACSAPVADDGLDTAAAQTTPVPVPAGTTTPTGTTAGGHVASHGMNLFGSERLYLSHIPLYSAPHNIQVIVEVKIASGVPEGQAQFGTKNFTVRPTAFSLDDLASGALHSITGTVFLGNFESGGTQAFRTVKFDVQRVIFQRAMSSSMPANASLDYIAVGTPTESYLVHFIDAPPSFEQIVNVKLPQNWLDAASLEAGTLVRIEGGSNTITKRLKPQAVVNGIRPVPTTGTGGTSTSGGTPSTSGGTTSGGTPSTSGGTTSGGTPSTSGGTTSGGTPSTSGGTTSGGTPSTSGGTTGAVSIQVLGENACLPGTDFYGTCPAAQ